MRSELLTKHGWAGTWPSILGLFIFMPTNSQQIMETGARVDNMNLVQGIRVQNWALESRHVPEFCYPHVLGIQCYAPPVFHRVSGKTFKSTEFSGKPFQFTKLQMLLNALEAFSRELLCAGGDCALQADGR